MRAAIHVNNIADHQREHGAAMKAGLERHGVQVQLAQSGYLARDVVDFSVIWGFRQKAIIASALHVLVMERGYLPDRFVWTSLGWDGLNGRARFPEPQDDGQRFDKFFGQHLKPWRSDGDYALLIGQVDGDVATQNVNLPRWYRATAERLAVLGHTVRYRPHPFTLRTRGGDARGECPPDAKYSTRPLDEDLARAALCVTWNSNTAVDAVLAGVPTVTMDEGSMAWAVSSHDVAAELVRPDRHDWCRRLSWCQWTLAEISDGTAWAVVREAM